MADSAQHALLFFSLDDALREVLERQRSGHPARYEPLDATRSAMVRAFFTEQAVGDGWVLAGDALCPLVTAGGVRIASGYSRLVVGDYGAFLECTAAQVELAALRARPIPSDRPIATLKYLWLETREHPPVKVYEQRATVRYADYRPGCYYVAPGDVRAPREHDTLG